MSPVIRAAVAQDGPAMGDMLWWFQQSNAWMPKLYNLPDCVSFCATMVSRGWVTVVECEGGPRGFLARDEAEICALYVGREQNGRGYGRLLLESAKRDNAWLWLRCFEANRCAQRFYRREGFVEEARSDGTHNEENLPDITYVWRREVVR